MEEEKKEDLKETDTEETSPESQESESKETEEESKDEEKDIDFDKELEKVQNNQPRSDLEKAQRALHFNAQRLKELGGDPIEVLGLKKDSSKDVDVRAVVQREFDERRAKSLSKSESHFKIIMHYVDNNKLSVDDAYLLSIKDKVLRSQTEIARGNVQFGKPEIASRKVDTEEVPKHPGEDMLLRRGYQFNPKTKTYQGKFYEEYFDQATKTWQSRKIKR